MKKCGYRLFIALVIIIIPFASYAQTPSANIYGLHKVLERLFDEMLPMCKRMMDIGRVIGGFAALSYIGVRVWKHIARAEGIDFFPLLRPFAIGLAIFLFTDCIALINGVLKPVEAATREMSGDASKAILYNIDQQEQALKKDVPAGIYPDQGSDMDKYQQPDGSSEEGPFSGLKNAFSIFNIKGMIKMLIVEVVQIIYTAIGLCINTIRTFYLLILAILGPLVFGLSIFDGFQNALSSWFARYINVYMWLPVANLFGAITSKILENMMTLDHDFFSSTAYIIFMIISIVGYTTVPNVASYIVQAGGKDTLLHKINNMTQTAGKGAAAAMGKLI
ncbi:conjugative transposon protein TraJ [Chitinophaga sp. RCC_12]|uniref:conjugative transposon protein TraJ n=1 Tax=Chitinophaga sp. RCC_12 TaxID=3239226 RepID=UPI003524980B